MATNSAADLPLPAQASLDKDNRSRLNEPGMPSSDCIRWWVSA